MNELIQKVLDVALGEVGYLEKETYDQLDHATANAGDENFTKYQRDLAKLSYFNGSKKGVAWCAVFVCWCFVQVMGEALAKSLLCQPDKGNCGAGCNSQMNYYKSKKCWHTSNPQPGDQIIFWNSAKKEGSHTGIVYKVDKTYVYTVEGNTSGASGVIANGGGVCSKKYKLTNTRIAGYGRPRWELAVGIESDVTPVQPETEKPESVEIPGMITGDAWVHVTSGSTVNYRTGPSTSYKLVAGMPRIKQGEQVYIKTSTDAWAAVEYKGLRGYVMMKYLTTTPPSVDASKPDTDNTTPPSQKTYVTVQGDTLWKISSRFLGKGNKYKKIMEVNGLKNTIIRPGMVLKIPEV